MTRLSTLDLAIGRIIYVYFNSNIIPIHATWLSITSMSTHSSFPISSYRTQELAYIKIVSMLDETDFPSPRSSTLIVISRQSPLSAPCFDVFPRALMTQVYDQREGLESANTGRADSTCCTRSSMASCRAGKSSVSISLYGRRVIRSRGRTWQSLNELFDRILYSLIKCLGHRLRSVLTSVVVAD